MIPAQALQRLIEQGDISIRHVWHEKNCSDHNAGVCTCGYHETLSGWDKAKKELLKVFEKTDQDELRIILGRAFLKVSPVGLKGTYTITNGDIERAIVKVRQRYTLPIAMDQGDLDHVLSHIFQWQMSSAYVKAVETIGFPSDALGVLQALAESYGDCGYQQGKVFEHLKKSIKEVTAMLDYEFDEGRSNSYFVRRQTATA